jgi:hypothetical protein
MIGGDLRYGFRRAGSQKRTSNQVHSPQVEIPDRSHSQMLLAGDSKRSLRYADGRANFRQVQRRVGVRFKEFFEPRHDRIVAATASGHSRRRTFGQAPDHQVDQLMLQGPSYLG